MANGVEAGPRDRSVCEELAHAGYLVASIACEPNHTPSAEAVIAGKCAIRFLRRSADKYSVDERRIGVAGASLGGALALLVGFTTQAAPFAVPGQYPNIPDHVSLVVSFAGPADWLTLPQGRPTGEHKEAIEKALRALAPLAYVRPNLPAVLLLHGTTDKFVPPEHAEKLARALSKNQVPHRLLRLDRVGHTFSLIAHNGRPLPPEVKSVVLAFLQTHLTNPWSPAP